MRTTKMGMLLVLGVLGTLVVGCGDADDGVSASTDTVAQGAETTLAPEPSTLIDELVALGVDTDAAPLAAVQDTGATFCGTADQRTTTGTISPAADATNGAGMGCFATHAQETSAADLIEVFTTVEGDPIVVVWRTTDGATVMHTDSTRDAFGSGTWSTQTCSSVRIAALDDSFGASSGLLCA
jgi:hypothetical protein